MGLVSPVTRTNAVGLNFGSGLTVISLASVRLFTQESLAPWGSLMTTNEKPRAWFGNVKERLPTIRHAASDHRRRIEWWRFLIGTDSSSNV
jgi:hypothetical protein